MDGANGWVDGRHTLPDSVFNWPVPVVLEIRRWHADASITQLCFNCGWKRVSPEVKDLERRMQQAADSFKTDPAYVEFKHHHGNFCLYSTNSEKLHPDNTFIAQCREWVDREYPLNQWTEVEAWCYGSNDDGWTILLKKKEQQA